MRRYLIVLALLLAACKPIAESAGVGPTDTHQPTVTYPPCQENTGSVIDYPYPPADKAWPLSKVYLPPCYDIHIQRDYPVLYLIHGAGGMPGGWLHMGLDQTMDRLIETGEIAPYIVVMPAIPRIEINGATYQDWTGENEWLTDELMVGVDAAYRTRQDRLYRGIGGISQGGAIAGLFGWGHPELFEAIGLFGAVQPAGGYSPGWTRRSAELSALLDSVPTNLTPHVYIDVGREDGLWINNLSSTLHLRERLMPYTFYIEEGAHSQVYWGSHLEEYLRWFDGVFGISASRLQRATPPKTVATPAHTTCGETTDTRTSIQINHPTAGESDWPATEIYLPPCYAEYDDVAYPVLYLLHSEGESPMQWFSIGAAETMDTLTAEGAVPPFILVAPPLGESLDDFAPWLVDTVLPAVEAQFHIVGHRAWRGVAGLSLGGTRAIEIGHAYPELYGSIGGYSAASPSAMDLLENAISETPPHKKPQILLDIGNRDPLKSEQESLHQLYTAYNWPHTSTTGDGAHRAAYWAERLEYYLVWHGNVFGSVIAQD